MAIKDYKKIKSKNHKTPNLGEIQNLKAKINDLKNLIIYMGFENKQLKMETTYLYNKLNELAPMSEDNDSCF